MHVNTFQLVASPQTLWPNAEVEGSELPLCRMPRRFSERMRKVVHCGVSSLES